jgi:hypothetical protein
LKQELLASGSWHPAESCSKQNLNPFWQPYPDFLYNNKDKKPLRATNQQVAKCN